MRPIAFLESCRRRFGDAFSVRFVGMRTPLVMVSDPAAVRALYSERENGLPPGRTFALRPLVGARSILLQEGAEHLQRRRLMLPAFHGERYGWIPFGGGVRRCLGAAFAEMEMRVVLRCVLRTRTLRAASADAERPTRRNVTLSPRHGTRIIIAPRSRIAARTLTRTTC